MKLRTSDAALRHFINNLPEHVVNVVRMNKGRDTVVITDNHKYYVKFKKDFLMTFNEQFFKFVNEHPEWRGVGETINIEHLRIAVGMGCKYIIIIYPDGKIYSIPPKLWFNFSTNNFLIRSQERGNSYVNNFNKRIVHETTCHIPVKLLRRFG